LSFVSSAATKTKQEVVSAGIAAYVAESTRIDAALTAASLAFVVAITACAVAITA